MMYAGDFSTRFPYTSEKLNTSGNSWTKWWDLVYPYVNEPTVYACPALVMKKDEISFNYSFPIGKYGTDTDPAYAPGGARMDAFQRPSATILFNERYYNVRKLGSKDQNSWAFRDWPTSISYWNEWSLPHNNGCNLAFADGRVEWYRMYGRTDPLALNPPLSVSFKIPDLFIRPDATY